MLGLLLSLATLSLPAETDPIFYAVMATAQVQASPASMGRLGG